MTIKEIYTEYLDMIRTPENQMHPIQKVQIKDAFYAGAGLMLDQMTERVAHIPEGEGVKVLQNLKHEIKSHFVKRFVHENSTKEQSK